MGLFFDEDWIADWQDKQNACKGYYLFTAFEKFKLCYYLVYLLDFVELCNNGFRDQYYENLISVLKLDKNKCPKLGKFPSKDERYEYELKFKKELRLILKECCVKYAKKKHDSGK